MDSVIDPDRIKPYNLVDTINTRSIRYKINVSGATANNRAKVQINLITGFLPYLIHLKSLEKRV